MTKPRDIARSLWKRFRWPLILLVVYLFAEQVLIAVAIDDGLFFPAVSGEGLFVVGLGLAVIVLRLLVLLLLPAILTYKAVMSLWK